MSRMKIPTPHSFTHKRPTDTLTEGRRIPSVEAIETGIPGIMSPGGTSTFGTGYGPIEIMQDTIYLEAINAAGATRVVRADDLLIDEDNNEVWRATAAGNTWQNPSLFALGKKVKHHTEVAVERVDPEDRHLA